MGNYANVANIEAYYTGMDFGEVGASVTSGEIDGFIETNEAIVDSSISSLYVVPITNVTDIKVLKKLVEYYTVCDVDGIFREKAQTDNTKFNYKRNTCKNADKLLKAICDKKIKLITPMRNTAPIKFNNINSNGDEVGKFFTDNQSYPEKWDGGDNTERCLENDRCRC